MIIEHSGWSQERGWFNDKYFVDEAKTDYEIHWKNGTVCKQQMPFQWVTADWNCDGDVYELFGASFEGKYAGLDWYTMQGLVDLVIEGEITVPGIEKIK